MARDGLHRGALLRRLWLRARRRQRQALSPVAPFYKLTQRSYLTLAPIDHTAEPPSLKLFESKVAELIETALKLQADVSVCE